MEISLSNIQTFEQELKSYSGRNAFSENTNLDPTQFRSIVNCDLFQGNDGDYLRSRRGSVRLVPDVDPIKQLGTILNKVVFPINGEEYLICAYVPDPEHPTVAFSSQPLLNIGNPVRIESNTWAIDGSTFLSELVLYGVDETNSDNFTLYWTYDEGANTLYIFKDSDLTELVASSVGMTAFQTNLIVEEISSGISGTVYSGALGVAPESGTMFYDFAELDSAYGTPDLKVYNNRVYVFHQSGNKIIQWDADQNVMRIRDLGMNYPYIESWDSEISGPTGMDEQGAYYYGLEKVVQLNDIDLYASTPNRKFPDGSIPLMLPTEGNIRLVIQKTGLIDDQSWTHIRLWRSKNTVPNFSDPLFPIDAQGVIDQLYEVALITRLEFFSAFAPIATGNPLPPGNAGVSAGLSGGNYYIQDTNTDDVLSDVVGIDLIELIPLPGCRTGDVNNGRMFSAGIGEPFLAPNGPLIDPSIAEDVLYSTNLFSEYQEQWEPQAFIPAGRDGKKTTCLLTLVEDLIVFREGMTKRIQQGNINAGIVMVDDKIGIPSFRMAGYIPGLGICAICSDTYFRYLGFDLAWHQTLNGTEISQSIYDLTGSNYEANTADFVYINGKLLMQIYSSDIVALNVKEGKGWAVYSYLNYSNMLFGFSNFSRVGKALDDTTYLMEIEVNTTDDEEGNNIDAPDQPIVCDFETYGFSGKGKLLEPTRYSFWGLLQNLATVTAKASGQTWEVLPTFQQPGLYESNPSLNEREYRFEPQPQTVGVMKWVPLRGQFISFSFSTVAPFMLSWQKLAGKIRQTFGNQQATLAGGIAPQGPGWANQSLMLLNLEDPGSTFYDASGKQLNHTWVASTELIPFGDFAPHLSNLVLSSVAAYPLYGTYYNFDPTSWRLWDNEADRDAQDMGTSLGYFDALHSAGTQPFIEENASGVSGTVDTDGGVDPDIENLDVHESVGTKSNRVSQKPGYGLTINAPGYINYQTDPVIPLLTNSNLTWKVAFKLGTGGTFVAQSFSDVNYLELSISSTSAKVVLFMFGGVNYTWEAEIDISESETNILVFTLSKAYAGQLYVESLSSASFDGKVSTARSEGGTATVPNNGHTIAGNGCTTSYYEVEKTLYKEEQAARFWGMMKAYPSGTVGP